MVSGAGVQSGGAATSTALGAASPPAVATSTPAASSSGAVPSEMSAPPAPLAGSERDPVLRQGSGSLLSSIPAVAALPSTSLPSSASSPMTARPSLHGVDLASSGGTVSVSSPLTTSGPLSDPPVSVSAAMQPARPLEPPQNPFKQFTPRLLESSLSLCRLSICCFATPLTLSLSHTHTPTPFSVSMSRALSPWGLLPLFVCSLFLF